MADPVIFTVTVNGVERRALVYPGELAFTAPAPVLFAFHGFNSSNLVMATTKLHRMWPQATVVYPLGLPAFSKRYQREVPAWQPAPQRDGDRDVAFIDALLADLRQTLLVDDRRIFAAGMSNGAMFCYVLLVERPQVFAGFACVAGAVDFLRDATVPRPIMVIHGKDDTTVALPAAEANRDQLCKLNGCGKWALQWYPGYLNYRPCTSGQPVIWHQHNGGHIWPYDASMRIVDFFKALAPDK